MKLREDKEIRLDHPHTCLMCLESLEPGLAVYITWIGPIGGIGYFHVGACANAMRQIIAES